jgi:hypothetical protein
VSQSAASAAGVALTLPNPMKRPLGEATSPGSATMTAWGGLHPKQRTYRGADGQLRIVAGTLVRVHVARLPACPGAQDAVAVVGRPTGNRPGAAACVAGYVRRFDLEHTIRLEANPALDPALPRTPEQADRFTWAVAAGYAQLRLARTIVTDLRLPWEQPLAPDQLTPERVRHRFRALLAVVARLPVRRNPTAGPQGVPEAPCAARHLAIQPSTHGLTSRKIQTTRLKAKPRARPSRPLMGLHVCASECAATR